jgi:hypothetical protein
LDWFIFVVSVAKKMAQKFREKFGFFEKLVEKN